MSSSRMLKFATRVVSRPLGSKLKGKRKKWAIIKLTSLSLLLIVSYILRRAEAIKRCVKIEIKGLAFFKKSEFLAPLITVVGQMSWPNRSSLIKYLWRQDPPIFFLFIA